MNNISIATAMNNIRCYVTLNIHHFLCTQEETTPTFCCKWKNCSNVVRETVLAIELRLLFCQLGI